MGLVAQSTSGVTLSPSTCKAATRKSLHPKMNINQCLSRDSLPYITCVLDLTIFENYRHLSDGP